MTRALAAEKKDKKKGSNVKNFAVHILGTILVLSALYHSMDLYSLAVVIPVFLVSFSIYKRLNWLKVPALVAATLYPSFTMAAGAMDEAFSLLIYSVIFVIPLASYWILVLTSEIDLKIEWKGVVIGVSYIALVLLSFYIIPSLLGISEFILSPGKRGPQALLLAGFGLLVMVPYQIILEFKNGSF